MELTSERRDYPTDWAYLALAHARKGNSAEARRWLERLRGFRPAPSITFWDLPELTLLQSEAESLAALRCQISERSGSSLQAGMNLLIGFAGFREGEAPSEPDCAMARREVRAPRIVQGHLDRLALATHCLRPS